MSWNLAKKRFQRDLEKVPKKYRVMYEAQQNKLTLPTFESNLPVLPKHEQRKDMVDTGLTNGDFAYIVKGKKVGTVSTIFQYISETDSVMMADVTSRKIIPNMHWIENQTSHLMDFPDPVPRSYIKLAAKDRDENGKVYYVVADEIEYKDRYYDERYKRWLPKRFIKHHGSIEIPWPNPPSDPQDGDLSTPENVVLEKTYELQSIARSPVPKQALDQLRTPFSKFRRRLLTEMEARKLNGPQMPLSDKQRIYMAKMASQPKKEYNKLSEEIQDFIGTKIAKHLESIENPSLLTHLDALSNAEVPDFEETMRKIELREQDEQSRGQAEGQDLNQEQDQQPQVESKD